MYLKHFNLQCMPFEIGPDPKFLWLGSKHKEAFAILHYGIIERKGFVLILGEPGTGKSTLLNATMTSFETDVHFAKIAEPALTPMEFVNFAADAFDMGQNFASKGEFLIRLKRFIRESGDRRLTLVIDEAQRLSPEMLEQIRVFSDIEAPGYRAFSCIFAGQPELLSTIKQNTALCQRIFFSHTLQVLTLPETGDYIAHRLKVAGCDEPLFEPASIEEIHRLSRGTPRLINILCDQALLTGYAALATRIGPDMIREGTESTLISLQTAPAVFPAPVRLPPAAAPQRIVVNGPGLFAPSPARSTRRISWGTGMVVFALLLAAFIFTSGGLDGTLGDPSGLAAADPQNAVGDDPLRSRLAELQSQKAAAEARLRESTASAAAMESRLRELQGAGGKAAEREHALSQKDATITELRQKLELLGAGQSSVACILESMKRENHQLQAQLSEAHSQQRLIETKLAQEQKLSAGASADAQALKAARNRVAQLEAAVSENTLKLARLEGVSTQLDRELLKEKTAREQANADLAARQTAIAALQEKLQTANSLQQKLQGELQSMRDDNSRLQTQVRELRPKLQEAAAPAARPASVSAPAAAASQPVDGGPDPAKAIDFVMKRKSQP
jgi:general secretion pathway protein A